MKGRIAVDLIDVVVFAKGASIAKGDALPIMRLYLGGHRAPHGLVRIPRESGD